MEAGNRCFDQRVPEELNRKIVDHLSDINMPLTEHARRYLLDEGIRPETVIKTGSTMKEVISHYWARINDSDVVDRLKLTPKKYFIVSAHREEVVDNKDRLGDFIRSLEAIAQTYDMPVIVSTHPRTRDRMEKQEITANDKRISFLKPMGFYDYVKMQMGAFCVVSDSGTITEEGSILNLPAIMIRQAHERPEGMDEGTVVMSGLNPERVLQAVELVTQHHARQDKRLNLIKDYDTENVSLKVVRTIYSYVDYINRTTWHKA
jgi:UDP-N-acetylglucosamine 2-epimerase (non-hydrolysing)